MVGEGCWGRVRRRSQEADTVLFLIMVMWMLISSQFIEACIHILWTLPLCVPYFPKFNKGKFNKHSLYKTTRIMINMGFFLRIELKYGTKHMGSGLNPCEILVLFGKKMVMLINIKLCQMCMWKLCITLKLSESMRRNWGRNKENSNTLKGEKGNIRLKENVKILKM